MIRGAMFSLLLPGKKRRDRTHQAQSIGNARFFPGGYVEELRRGDCIRAGEFESEPLVSAARPLFPDSAPVDSSLNTSRHTW
jgi:hypothetical protein